MLSKIIKSYFGQFGYKLIKADQAIIKFHSDRYLRHNSRRLEHLASLHIPVSKMSVLEVGAGIGDHSHYYIDRGCEITITEARKENLEYLHQRYPDTNILQLDLDNPVPLKDAPFDVVHCYGTLYHLKNPESALTFLSQCCKQLLLLETCVSFGEDEKENLVKEPQKDPTQAFAGIGCRPTRPWILSRLKKHFEYVYIPKTQPNHEEFPIDWTNPEKHTGLSRAIFIASRSKLDNEMLTPELLVCQEKHN